MYRIISFSKEYKSNVEKFFLARTKIFEFSIRQVAWSPPLVGWIKLNTDDSIINQNFAAWGGVVRGHMGNFIAGFSTRIGVCSIT